MKRRNILIGMGAVALGAGVGGAYAFMQGPTQNNPAAGGAASGPQLAAAGDMALFEDDRILGADDAPVTIIEYSSLTCPHCASFHRGTMPQVKTNWIDTGRARLVYRHYPLDRLALRAAAAANCIEGDGFFGFIDVLFNNQERWSRNQDPMGALQQFAGLAGLSPEAFEACIADEATITRILEIQTDGRDTYEVASTPSFVINGQRVVGARDYGEFDAALTEFESEA
ncbi:DsbA family protein [Pelagibius litoralis]|uniref:DsbA family protein n=1 Tax=Pelagibius litoralis TaxID=374515 RepID=A0A967F1X9_9PROT|nr:thioredoxin domain-containing protein [Pelagibius litoralis]NIA71585.1 DsbA family protein [Pelagibius litoralis]